MTFETDFPSSKKYHAVFNEIQKDIIGQTCLDRKRVLDAIDKKLSCSLYNLPIGKQCDDEDCQNCTKNKELKKEILKC